MQILRAERYKRMAWKNGGGETTEIAVFPPEAGLDDFAWRVSMAHIGADGAFSRFNSVQRTLSVLTGEGLALRIDGRAPIILGRESDPFSFPADVETTAHLQAGPITDLNVMTRTGRYAHRVVRLAVMEEVRVGAADAATLAVAMSACSVNERYSLGRFDSVLLDLGETARIAPSGAPVALFSIEFRPADGEGRGGSDPMPRDDSSPPVGLMGRASEADPVGGSGTSARVQGMTTDMTEAATERQQAEAAILFKPIGIPEVAAAQLMLRKWAAKERSKARAVDPKWASFDSETD
jgi:uncharacterized protein